MNYADALWEHRANLKKSNGLNEESEQALGFRTAHVVKHREGGRREEGWRKVLRGPLSREASRLPGDNSAPGRRHRALGVGGNRDNKGPGSCHLSLSQPSLVISCLGPGKWLGC